MVRRLLGFLVLLFGMALAVHADAPIVDEQEQNRNQLEKFKKDKAHYERLRESLQEFLALPRERQDSMRQLVRDLGEENAETRARLLRVLERYVDWMEGLPETERQSILKAGSRDERLRMIQQVCERQWIAGLPRKIQDELQTLPGQQKAARLAQLRQHDVQMQNQWELAMKYWDKLTPWRNVASRSFLKDLEDYVEGSLKPALTPQELQRLEEAKNKFPQYQVLILELDRKHPPIALPGPSTGPRHFDELPAEVRRQLPPRANPAFVKKMPNAKLPNALAKNDGRWPQYARAVTMFAANNNIKLAVQLGPSGPKDKQFSAVLQNFIEKKLTPVLTTEEKETLTKAEGRWPQYPDAVKSLAEKHVLGVPGTRLPGPAFMWNSFPRSLPSSTDSVPQLDDQSLRTFVESSPSEDQRERLPLYSPTDPIAREAWTREYFVRHPEELKQRQDQKKTGAR